MTDPSASSSTPLIGRAACTDALRQMLLALAGTPDAKPGVAQNDMPSDIWLIDHHFAGWPLDDAAVQQALALWLRSGGHRRLHLIGADFEAVARNFPRFSRWRRDWSHCIDIQQPADREIGGATGIGGWAGTGGLPRGLRLMMAGRQALQWLDAPDMRIRTITDPVHLAALRSEIADFLQRCEPAWPVTPLGL